MAKDLIRYDLLVQEALRGVVRKLLADAVRDGLPGDHYFYISFRTDHPGVRLSSRQRERYPHEMTIVLQHQFWDLAVTDQAFEVGLSFQGVPERLMIPFEAVVGFYDPSVQFGLKFGQDGETGEAEGGGPTPAAAEVRDAPEPAEVMPSAERIETPAAEAPKAGEKATAAETPVVERVPQDNADGKGAQVVSLDAFRKKT
ncbi:SspB family protein [Chelatococcus sp. XZ-Ab1]|uniref:SspB family protein n=1 Tax=Chelatococcus sp. XZ-Ab1 TaxID=3034027 RepID=UPI0023E3CDCE|nr:SspB family protein [Chelatococcus sp. XZ-Ab1]